jgi:dolichyl-phosphate-mannose--protein O-mannosyl transferase
MKPPDRRLDNKKVYQVAIASMKISWKKIAVGAGLLIGIALYTAHLNFPAKPYFDEVYHVKTARQFLHFSRTMTDTVHPPLAKLVMTFSMLVFGDHPWTWRLPSLLCGLMTILTVFYIARLLIKDKRTALLTAFLFSLEGLHLTQSRIAMLNAQMMMWMMLTLAAMLPYLMDRQYPRSRSFLYSGLFLGLAVSCRWVGILVLPVLLIFMAGKFFQERNKLAFLRDFFLFIMLVPALIYAASHSIMMVTQDLRWKDIWDYQFRMWHYHATLREGHRYGSEWWSWPVLLRPIWYFFVSKNQIVNGILCIGNPAIYWLMPFALGYILFKWIEERSFLYGFILMGFFSQWLPWAWIGRTKFFHYFYSAVPFAILAVVLLLQRIWQIEKTGKWVVAAYLAIVIGLFIYWYPLYAGWPISETYFRNHMWFTAWI